MKEDELSRIEARAKERYPFEEDFVDHSGARRRFRISNRELPDGGNVLTARELREPEGYQFEHYSSSRLPDIGELRSKIRRKLATRYLYISADGNVQLTHDVIEGHISCRGIVVDGQFLAYDKLMRMLDQHEGFGIRIEITDAATT